MNMLTDPLCLPPPPGPPTDYCTLSPSSPDESYQLHVLRQAASIGLPIPYVELGNEYYLAGANSDYTNVYPTVQDYAQSASKWITDIRNLGLSPVKIAAVGFHTNPYSAPSPREAMWNQGLLNGSTPLTGEDAVVLHIYSPTNLAAGDSINSTTAETMLLVPFTTWDSVVNTDLPSLIPANGPAPSVWITEYNLTDQSVAAFGTWAHGLYTASMSLVLLENPRIQIAIHHEAQANTAIFADIFQSTCAFDPKLACKPGAGGTSNQVYPPNGANITTVVNGYSATGLTQAEIDTAALGQQYAVKLTFPGAPTFDGTHPTLYGWIFYNQNFTSSQAVILNLNSVAATVDVSGIISSGTFRQIYGPAGTYVTGGTVTGGFAGSGGNLKVKTGTITQYTKTLTLSAFSITRTTVP